MLVDRANLAGLNTGFNTSFNDAFGAVEITHGQVSMTINSTTRENAYGWMGKIPSMREWLGDRVINSIAQDGQTIVNKTYENTIGVAREDIEDDQYGIYTPMFSELGRTSAEHPDLLVWDLLKNAFTQTCYDGQFFVDTDHPRRDVNGNEVSQSNHGGGASTPWFLLDTTRAIRPFVFQSRKNAVLTAMTSLTDENVFMRNEFIWGVDGRWAAGYGLWQLAYGSKQTLDATNFNAALTAMQEMKGDFDRPLRLKPNLLVVPPSLRSAALEITKAERQANGATNINQNVVDVHVENLLV